MPPVCLASKDGVTNAERFVESVADAQDKAGEAKDQNLYKRRHQHSGYRWIKLIGQIAS